MPSIDPNFLHVSRAKIVNGRGETILLRGLCLGGWMNMENFITGYPGHESGLRSVVEHVLGKEKAHFFFERFLHYFIQEDDLKYIKDLGCNLIRIPLNYRHFEDDDRPFEYKAEGFALLDKIIAWARGLELYVILDLHAVQGWQNRGWHCDNPCGEPHFFGQKACEDRAVALWQEFARRYKDEAFVAGYNVMNEPDADDVTWLNHYYRRVTQSIRLIDTHHIIFLEGNRSSQQFDALDPPFDPNTVYSSHNYVEPMDGMYPGVINGEAFDRARLEQDYRDRASFMLRHKVPNWVGEFGCLYENPALIESNLRVMNDMIDIIEGYGHHWSIWTYKDIGMMGAVLVNPESEWMRRTMPVRLAEYEARFRLLLEQLKKARKPLMLTETGFPSAVGYRREGERRVVPESDNARYAEAMQEFLALIHRLDDEYDHPIRGLYFYEWRDNLHHDKIWNVEGSPIHVAFGLCDRFGVPKLDIRRVIDRIIEFTGAAMQ
jgi:endoglucanase